MRLYPAVVLERAMRLLEVFYARHGDQDDVDARSRDHGLDKRRSVAVRPVVPAACIGTN